MNEFQWINEIVPSENDIRIHTNGLNKGDVFRIYLPVTDNNFLLVIRGVNEEYVKYQLYMSEEDYENNNPIVDDTQETPKDSLIKYLTHNG